MTDEESRDIDTGVLQLVAKMRTTEQHRLNTSKCTLQRMCITLRNTHSLIVFHLQTGRLGFERKFGICVRGTVKSLKLTRNESVTIYSDTPNIKIFRAH